jgi:replicative DNA helicase
MSETESSKTDAPAPSPSALAPTFALAGLVEAVGEFAEVRRAAKLENRPLGPVTGFPTLDTMLSGCLMPGLHVLHGGPGIGKSALALQVATACQAPALFVSCEISPIEALLRLIARHSGTYLNYLKDGSKSGDHIRGLAVKVAAQWPLVGFMDANRYDSPISHIGEAMERLSASVGSQAAAPGGLIVVDSGNTWASKNSDKPNEYEALTWALSQMEALAHSLSVPVLLIAERNRGNMASGGQNSSKGTGRWEYAGESVFGIDKEKEEEDGQGWTPVKLSVSKNRHGKTGSVPLRWNGALQTYEVREK